MKKNYISYLILTCMIGGISACTPETHIEEKKEEPPVDPIVVPHEHSFTGDYVYDEENHWKICDGKDCDEIAEIEAHVFNGTNLCEKCGYDNGKGYIKKPVSFTINDAAGVYTPEEGDLKMFVIPVNLVVPNTALESGHYLDTWDEEILADINNMYFGSGVSHGYKTFKDYYETASYGKVHFSGEVSSVVDLEFTAEQFQETFYGDDAPGYYGYLDEIVKRAVETTPGFDPTVYDINNDGYFDAINFITNYHGAEWGESFFWPHMTTYVVDVPGTLGIRSFSLDSIEFMNETGAEAPTHEQGHIFGVNDYYDYTMTGIDYCGGFDEQDSNDSDWNAFSKMMTGWIEPTIITGEIEKTTITLNSTQNNEHPDCLVIPANYSEYNGSAFDEYFLVELINDTGNNALRYKTLFGYNSKGYGVRVSHVLGDIYSYTSEGNIPLSPIDSLEDCKTYCESDYPYKTIMFGANNNFYSSEYQYEYKYGYYDAWDYWGEKKYNEYPLYCVIQNGFQKTFGKKNQRQTICESDLFYTNDSFTFQNVKKFLYKSGVAIRTSAIDTSFPYTVTFDEVNHDSFTVTVTKN